MWFMKQTRGADSMRVEKVVNDKQYMITLFSINGNTIAVTGFSVDCDNLYRWASNRFLTMQ